MRGGATCVVLLIFFLLGGDLAIGTTRFTVSSAQAADYTNSIGMEFNNIPAGSFYMGICKLTEADKEANKKRHFMGQPTKGPDCPSGRGRDYAYASDDETPQHKVRISKGFQMGVYEVTVKQFKQFIAGAGRDDLLTSDFMRYNFLDNAAVNRVSWNDAQDFIRWLNRKEGGNHYRLPTEAEWEYCARAGTTTLHFWGDGNGLMFSDANEREAEIYAWFSQNQYDRHDVHPVGVKQPNQWGLYDMLGNAWEWVQDWYGGNYYRNSPTDDPKGPSSGVNRVFRGGSRYSDDSFKIRSTVRGADSPNFQNFTVGFRLLRQP